MKAVAWRRGRWATCGTRMGRRRGVGAAGHTGRTNFTELWDTLSPPPPLLRAVLAAALTFLASCTALPANDPTQPLAPDNYGVVISNALKKFKDFATYANFEISSLRWVHTTSGWSWLACVRYDDHEHRRTYAFFVKDNAVVDARYNVMADACGSQQYIPFDATTGAIGSAALGAPSPLY